MSTPTNALLQRIVIAAQSTVVLAQAITAGLMLMSHVGQPLHSAGGYTLFGLTLVHLGLAVLAWRQGGGSPVPVLYAAGFVGAVVAQVYIGIAHVMVVHAPLGVLLFGASVLYFGRIRVAAPASPHPGGNSRPPVHDDRPRTREGA
jgi:hypothetical protein